MRGASVLTSAGRPDLKSAMLCEYDSMSSLLTQNKSWYLLSQELAESPSLGHRFSICEVGGWTCSLFLISVILEYMRLF